jgi:hypothetical protein
MSLTTIDVFKLSSGWLQGFHLGISRLFLTCQKVLGVYSSSKFDQATDVERREFPLLTSQITIEPGPGPFPTPTAQGGFSDVYRGQYTRLGRTSRAHRNTCFTTEVCDSSDLCERSIGVCLTFLIVHRLRSKSSGLPTIAAQSGRSRCHVTTLKAVESD